ncbi:hypothetical protein NQ318_021272 [Aromia moschata]|uniref:Uncharacterized protein n=1 Tax=Aromia moschata TaxID=1265417 RepID=A0AAV8ZBM0_9CUCU|nr:hypothetical protein NQ318_021272 [Aromia moschata]
MFVGFPWSAGCSLKSSNLRRSERVRSWSGASSWSASVDIPLYPYLEQSHKMRNEDFLHQRDFLSHKEKDGEVRTYFNIVKILSTTCKQQLFKPGIT